MRLRGKVVISVAGVGEGKIPDKDSIPAITGDIETDLERLLSELEPVLRVKQEDEKGEAGRREGRRQC